MLKKYFLVCATILFYNYFSCVKLFSHPVLIVNLLSEEQKNHVYHSIRYAYQRFAPLIEQHEQQLSIDAVVNAAKEIVNPRFAHALESYTKSSTLTALVKTNLQAKIEEIKARKTYDVISDVEDLIRSFLKQAEHNPQNFTPTSIKAKKNELKRLHGNPYSHPTIAAYNPVVTDQEIEHEKTKITQQFVNQKLYELLNTYQKQVQIEANRIKAERTVLTIKPSDLTPDPIDLNVCLEAQIIAANIYLRAHKKNTQLAL